MKATSIRGAGQRQSAEIPNKLTAKILRRSKTGKGVKHFTSKKALYADLDGLM
jgi:hypothetical protein